MKTHPTGLRRLYRDMLVDAAQKTLQPCKHILVPGQYHCAVCGERIRFDGPDTIGKRLKS